MISVIDDSPEQFSHSIAKNTAAIHHKGIEIYRRNLLASAARALEISFPTILSLLGSDGMKALAANYLQENSLHGGDWGEWGSHLPEWILLQPELSDLPYLSDVAKLDWICHTVERSKDPSEDIDSISLLAALDPDKLYLKSTTCFAVLSTDFPLLEIWKAHYSTEDEKPYWLNLANKPLSNNESQYLLISRSHWRAHPKKIQHSQYLFIQALLQGEAIGSALEIIQNRPKCTQHEWLPDALKLCIEIGLNHLP